MGKKVNLKVLPDNYNKEIEAGSRLMDAINENNIFIESTCGGKGKCGKCKVKLLEGKISNITEDEKRLLSEREIDEKIVLACERTVLGDITIEIINKNKDMVEKGQIIKSNKNINPIVEKIYLELPLPSLKDQRSDIKRILDYLKEKNNRTYKFDINLIPKIQETLLENDYKVTVTTLNKEVIKIQGNNHENQNYGIAIDIGTTTVAAYLIDFVNGKIIDNKSNLNLQKKYGADVISRINYSIENKKNKENLQNEIATTIDKIIEKLLINNKISKADISIVSMVGNTTMSHLLVGACVKGIARAPFNSVFSDKIIGKVGLLNLSSLDENTRFILLPNIGGYVGSDTLGAIISSDMKNMNGNTLLIDVGTNCELALKTDKEILVCSTAAGPAFEGANMKYGMRASEGAIYSCDIDLNEDINIKTIENKEDPVGICGSGYINLISKLVEKDIILPQGRIVKPDKLDDNVSQKIKDRINKDGKSYELILSNNKNNKKVSITQEDIANLQLAKAAVRTGIELLMREGKIEKLDQILMAGAFGSNLDIDNIKNIGMIPNIESDKIKIIGNAAGSGAIQTILHKDKYDNMNELVDEIKHVELANHKDFNKIFTDSLML